MSGATQAPQWITSLPEPAAEVAPVLVTGGTGTLGRQVVDELSRAAVPVRVLSRTTGNDDDHLNDAVQRVVGDLTSGAGLAEAVAGVQAVVHCATSPTHPQAVDVEGTRRLADALTTHAADAHLVLIGILGAHANPSRYYRAKVAAETVVTSWGGPHTILRATQFHTLVRTLTERTVGPLGLGVRGLRFASIDPRCVATRAAQIALAEPYGDVVEMAGPETLEAREISILTARVRGVPAPRVVTVPAIGGVLSAFARGSNLPGPHVERIGPTYAQWLADQL